MYALEQTRVTNGWQGSASYYSVPLTDITNQSKYHFSIEVTGSFGMFCRVGSRCGLLCRDSLEDR